MTAEVPVHVNRQELHSLEVPTAVDAEGDILLRLINHGESSHVHVHLDDTLSAVATLSASNHYVEGDSERSLRIEVNEDALSTEPIRGKLKVAAAYGASTHWIDVELSKPDPNEGKVRVDESLAQPQPKPEPEESTSPLLARPEVPVFALAGIALVVAVAAAMVLQNVYAFVGALVVLVGLAVAVAFLVRG